MLKLEEEPRKYDGRTMAEQFMEDSAFTLKEKVMSAIELVKTLPIDGCITGSCMLPGFDPEGWGTVPDVDVFVFGENELTSAIEIARHALKMVPGSGTERSQRQEEWKLQPELQAGHHHVQVLLRRRHPELHVQAAQVPWSLGAHPQYARRAPVVRHVHRHARL